MSGSIFGPVSGPTKLLIGFDGSAYAEIALRDLQRAGLPAALDAVVLTVTDDLSNAGWRYQQLLKKVESRISATNAAALATQLMEEAHAVAKVGCSLLQAAFPGWRVQPQFVAELPAWGILWKATEFKPDILVIGTHYPMPTHQTNDRLATIVLTQAPCSVRIGRDHGPDPQRPLRILIAIDGSKYAFAAAQIAAQRTWPAGTDLRLVMVLDTRLVMALGSQGALKEPASRAFEQAAQARAAQILHALGEEISRANPAVTHSLCVHFGEPQRILLEEAERWGADSIFLGARGDSHDPERLLGTVALSVAAHARCSVEVIRIYPSGAATKIA
jgi:nucleotide-binding universal stress UspA family protein